MTHRVNKQAVAQAFGRAADGYERYADFQRYSGERLMALLPPSEVGSVLDAGCGTGWFSRRWREKGHQVIALDLSPGMLAQARRDASAQHYLLGDIEALPLQRHSVDISWSNLAVQWCDSLAQGIRELHRVTRPGGSVLFSTLADASLHEMRSAWQALDNYQHVNTFLPETAIRGMRRTGAAAGKRNGDAALSRCAERLTVAERHRRYPYTSGPRQRPADASTADAVAAALAAGRAGLSPLLPTHYRSD